MCRGYQEIGGGGRFLLLGNLRRRLVGNHLSYMDVTESHVGPFTRLFVSVDGSVIRSFSHWENNTTSVIRSFSHWESNFTPLPHDKFTSDLIR